MITDRFMYHPDICPVCGKDINEDDIYEFVDNDGDYAICHLECGLAKGWEMS